MDTVSSNGAFDACSSASFGTHDLSNDTVVVAGVWMLMAYLCIEQKDDKLKTILDGDTEGMLADEAEVLKTFIDTEDVAECFTIRQQ